MIEPYWIKTLSALLTPAIAMFAVLIAYLQWKTAERKRKQDLFDKRYEFYQKIWHLYSRHTKSPDAMKAIQETDLLDLAHECEFLFGQDIVDHLFKIPEKQNPDCLDYDWFSKPFKKYLKL